MSECCCAPNDAKEAPCCEPAPGAPERTIIVELCYLDVTTCERCQGADQQVDKAVAAVRAALAPCGCSVESRKILIEDEAMARQYHLVSSPTIRVDGIDICDTVEENDCAECSDIADTDVTCRVFEYRGQKHDVPPVSLIIDTVLRVYLDELSFDLSQETYELPENLARFFSGKRADKAPAKSC